MTFGFGMGFPRGSSAAVGNPFAQIGPTLDLVFAGVATNPTDPYAYTLNANFIVPQYQIAVNYSVLETGVGLVSKNFSDIVTFTRASTATYYSSTGVLTSAAIDAPRFDYNPATLAPLGLLIEEARTNLITYSEQFNTAPWLVFNTTVTADAIVAPDSTTTADLVLDTATAGVEHYVYQNISTVTNQSYTQSVFVKASAAPSFLFVVVAIGASSTVSLITFTQTAGVYAPATTANGLITSATATSVGNGWYRCSVVYTLNGTVTAHQMRLYPYLGGLYTGTGIGTYFWGAQLEVGAFPTSYIPTVAATVTRAADLAAVNTLSPWYNAVAGTFVAKFDKLANASSTRVLTASLGTNVNQIRINTTVATNIRLDWQIINSTVIQANVLGTVVVAPNVLAAVAGTYTANYFQQATNTSLGVAVTSGTVPTVSQLNLGANEGGGGILSGHIARITYYPRRMSDAELQIVTDLGA